MSEEIFPTNGEYCSDGKAHDELQDQRNGYMLWELSVSFLGLGLSAPSYCSKMYRPAIACCAYSGNTHRVPYTSESSLFDGEVGQILSACGIDNCFMATGGQAIVAIHDFACDPSQSSRSMIARSSRSSCVWKTVWR